MKRVLQVVLLFYSALALLYPQAGNVPSLLLLSVSRGVASSFLWLTSWAYVSATQTGRPRERRQGSSPT